MHKTEWAETKCFLLVCALLDCAFFGMSSKWNLLLLNVIFLECARNGMCSNWNEPFWILLFWNVLFLESAQHGMCPFWKVLDMECAPYGMCPFWNVPFLECDQKGILSPFWKVHFSKWKRLYYNKQEQYYSSYGISVPLISSRIRMIV